jgi:hypothetical protein
MSAPGLIASIAGTIGKRKAKKGLLRELKNAPKYKIAEETFQNQALAKGQAFGRDRAIQQGQEDISQSAVNASAQARDITSSTSALLNTISQIEAGKQANLRGLAGEDAYGRQQKLQNLMQVNNQVIDEKDKAFDYNINQPFQNRVAMYRDQRKANEEMELAGVAAQAQTESAFISSFGSMIAGSDENIKKNIIPSQYGIEEIMGMDVVTYQYKGSEVNHVGLIAQEVRQIVPEAVRESDFMTGEGSTTKILAINYNEIVPVLIQAIQDQQRQLDALQTKLKIFHVI